MSSILPLAIADENNLALEECAKLALDIDIKKFLIYPIENLDDKFLPYLAREFHCLGIEGWNLALEREAKENLIKNSIQKHSIKGTIPSIKQALSDLGFECEIVEFFEYNGRIGHFKIEFVNIYDTSLTDELEEEFKKVINEYKPRTRILDNINYYIASKGYIYYFQRLNTLENIIISTKGEIL